MDNVTTLMLLINSGIIKIYVKSALQNTKRFSHEVFKKNSRLISQIDVIWWSISSDLCLEKKRWFLFIGRANNLFSSGLGRPLWQAAQPIRVELQAKPRPCQPALARLVTNRTKVQNSLNKRGEIRSIGGLGLWTAGTFPICWGAWERGVVSRNCELSLWVWRDNSSTWWK